MAQVEGKNYDDWLKVAIENKFYPSKQKIQKARWQKVRQRKAIEKAQLKKALEHDRQTGFLCEHDVYSYGCIKCHPELAPLESEINLDEIPF